MKRIILLVFVPLAWTLNLISQDTVYTNDGRIITGEILESEESTVRLRPDSAGSDFEIIISKYLIDSIIFRDGTVKSYLSLERSILPEVNNSGEFFVGFDLLSPLNGNARISLEYRLRPGGTGIFLPVTLNMKKKYNHEIYPPFWYSENSVGLGMKFNIPIGMKDNNYSISLVFTGGNYYYPKYGYYSFEDEYTEDRFLELGISNSLHLNIYSKLYFGFSLDNILFSFYKPNNNDLYYYSERQVFFYPIFHFELIIKI